MVAANACVLGVSREAEPVIVSIVSTFAFIRRVTVGRDPKCRSTNTPPDYAASSWRGCLIAESFHDFQWGLSQLCDTWRMESQKLKETSMNNDSLSDSITLSELDLALVNALQLRPRASWVELAEPLGTTATTLARRWERLSAAGLAWVAAAPGPEFGRSRCISYIMIRVEPNARKRVVDDLAQWSEVATIEVATGGHDLNVDVLTHDLRELDQFLTDKVFDIPGIISVDILLTTAPYLRIAISSDCFPNTGP